MYHKKLRALRDENNLLQKDIASILQIDQRIYSSYELGKKELPANLLIKLSKYYNVSTDYILDLTDMSIMYPRKHI